MIRSLTLAAVLVLAGCTATGSAVPHDADHPAAAEAAAAPHHAHADALPQAAAVYAPSGMPAGDHAHAGHGHHAASGDGCPMGCCTDGACTMPCCQKDGAAGEGHRGHDHAAGGHEGHAHAGNGEACQMACCQEGGSCSHGEHGDHAAHGARTAQVDLSRPATGHAHHAADPVDLPADARRALRDALDAYLVISDRLAGDSMAGVAEQARTLEAATATLSEAAALRSHAEHLATIRQHAAHLAGATALPDARGAFGEMSPAFAHLVASAGVPEGVEVTRFVCGMADAPEGGVWLQRSGEPRNPYFGSAMLRCHRSQQVL